MMDRFRVVITWTGLIIFGIPALLAIPALIATVDQFGLWQTLTQALPLAALAYVPLLLWVRYIRHRPSSKWGVAAWSLVVALVLALLLVSSLWFWAGPILFLLTLEVTNNLLRRAFARRGHAGGSSTAPAAAPSTEVARRKS